MKTKPIKTKKERPFFRYLIFAAEILLLWLLQSTPRLLPELFGTKPFLLLAAALSFACCAEVVPSVVLGAVCGVLADISSGGTVGLFAVTFTLLCFAQASVLGTYLNSNPVTAAVLSLGSAAVILFAHFLVFRAFSGAPDAAAMLPTHYLPRLALTMIAFFPLYAFNCFIKKKL